METIDTNTLYRDTLLLIQSLINDKYSEQGDIDTKTLYSIARDRMRKNYRMTMSDEDREQTKRANYNVYLFINQCEAAQDKDRYISLSTFNRLIKDNTKEI